MRISLVPGARRGAGRPWPGVFALALGAVALGAVFAISASSAFAASVELGRCQKLAGEKVGHKRVYHGAYSNHTCTKASLTGEGRYEWAAGPGSHPGFAGTGGKALFIEGDGSPEPVTECAGSSVSGEYTSASAFVETIVYSGCSRAREICVEALGGREPECPQPCNNDPERCEAEEFRPCASAGALEGEVRTARLQGAFGFLAGAKKAKQRVAIQLRGEGGGFAGFECGGEGVGWTGSLTGSFHTTDRMALDFAGASSQGDQAALEGESGHVGFSARPTASEPFANEEALEVRVLE